MPDIGRHLLLRILRDGQQQAGMAGLGGMLGERDEALSREPYQMWSERKTVVCPVLFRLERMQTNIIKALQKGYR